MKTDILGMEKVTLVDWENKISCIFFVGGCNFKCPFCHNYDLVLNANKLPSLDDSTIFDYLEKRKKTLDGVVISGGEPTLYESIIPLITRIKSLGLQVKLDTNGTNLKMVKYLVENKLIDYIAMDIKSSLENYNATCGTIVDTENISKSISYIMSCGIDYEFRTTLVKELHTDTDIIKIASLLKGAKRYYLQKFVDHGTCLVNGLHEVPKKEAQQYVELLLPYIQNVSLRGY